MNRPKRNRGKKLIRPALQFKIMFVTLMATILVLLVNLQLCYATMWDLVPEVVNDRNANSVTDNLRQFLMSRFYLTVGVGVPFVACLSVLYSFTFCGPLYRMKQHMIGLRSGSWRRLCRLRRNDELKDIAAELDRATEFVCNYADDTHDLCDRVEEVVAKLGDVEDAELRELVQRLEESVAAERVFYAKHFQVESREAKVEPTPAEPAVAQA